MSDSIELRNIRVDGKIGVTPAERKAAQPLDISLYLELDLSKAEASDILSDTVDYAALHRQITKIVSSTSYKLLERLGGEILNRIFEDRRVTIARISLAKLERLDGVIPVVTLQRTNPKL